MTTYNTGNAIGSVDVRDLYDNAQNLDEFSNSPSDFATDRFGVSRETLQGIRNASQYQFLGAYAAGLEFTSYNQVFSSAGEFYAPSAGLTLPYTTTGSGAAEIATFRSVGDAVLRDDLADDTDPAKGSGQIGYDQALLYPAGSVGAALQDAEDAALGARASVISYGAIGGATDDTAAFTAAAADTNVIYVPYNPAGWTVNSGVVNAASMFIFEGGASQLLGTATAAQLRAVFFDGGQIGGIPFIDAMRSSKIGIVAGVIRQNASTRTQWDYINDSAHTPVGVSGSFATAAGGSITIAYDQTYSRVISFVATPDETFANVMGASIGASVGLSSTVINASANFTGSFTVSYNGATWDIASGSGQNIAPVFTSFTTGNGTLRINHGYCRGVALNINPYSAGGAVNNPYIPVIKTTAQTFVDVNFMDPTTGLLVVGAANTRMKLTASKTNAAGLHLDGTNDATVINGTDITNANIWFFGIFEK